MGTFWGKPRIVTLGEGQHHLKHVELIIEEEYVIQYGSLLSLHHIVLITELVHPQGRCIGQTSPSLRGTLDLSASKFT